MLCRCGAQNSAFDPSKTTEQNGQSERLNRLALLEKGTDPNKGPSPGYGGASLLPRRRRPAGNDNFYARGIVHEERAQFYAQHTERRVQALLRRGFKPSKKLELKRFRTLKRVASNPLLTNDYLGRGLRADKDARAAECAVLVARFFAEREVTVCASEKTGEQVVTKIGRPPISGQRMKDVERKRRSRPLQGRRGRKPIGAIAKTTAERVREHRRKKQLTTLAAPSAAKTGVGQPLPQGRSAPVNFLQKERKHDLATQTAEICYALNALRTTIGAQYHNDGGMRANEYLTEAKTLIECAFDVLRREERWAKREPMRLSASVH